MSEDEDIDDITLDLAESIGSAIFDCIGKVEYLLFSLELNNDNFEIRASEMEQSLFLCQQLLNEVRQYEDPDTDEQTLSYFRKLIGIGVESIASNNLQLYMKDLLEAKELAISQLRMQVVMSSPSKSLTKILSKKEFNKSNNRVSGRFESPLAIKASDSSIEDRSDGSDSFSNTRRRRSEPTITHRSEVIQVHTLNEVNAREEFFLESLLKVISNNLPGFEELLDKSDSINIESTKRLMYQKIMDFQNENVSSSYDGSKIIRNSSGKIIRPGKLKKKRRKRKQRPNSDETSNEIILSEYNTSQNSLYAIQQLMLISDASELTVGGNRINIGNPTNTKLTGKNKRKKKRYATESNISELNILLHDSTLKMIGVNEKILAFFRQFFNDFTYSPEADKLKSVFYEEMENIYKVYTDLVYSIQTYFFLLDPDSALYSCLNELKENLLQLRVIGTIDINTKILKEGNVFRKVFYDFIMDLELKTELAFHITGNILTQLTLEKQVIAEPDNQNVYLYIFSLMKSSVKLITSIMNTVESLYFLSKYKLPVVKTIGSIQIAQDIERREANMIDIHLQNKGRIYEDIRKLFQRPYLSMDIDEIILNLSSFYTDDVYVEVFSVTYSQFINSAELLLKLISRYKILNKEPVSESEHESFCLQVKILRVLEKLLPFNFFRFGTFSLEILEWFKSSIEDVSHIDKIQNITDMIETNYFRVPDDKDPILSIDVWDTTIPPHKFITEYKASAIALQLTIIDFDIYSRIEKSELLGQAWTNEKLLSSNVLALVERLNKISYWVATSILMPNKPRDRAKIFQRMINIAKVLYNMKNFHTLMGFISAFNMCPIYRLKNTLSNVSKKYTDIWKKLEEACSFSSSYKNLRALLESAETALPYFGIVLTDLTFSEDGNDTKESDAINFEKQAMIHEIIENALKFQKSEEFSLSKRRDPLYSYLVYLPTLSDDILFSLSYQQEPKD
eukprot:TRINITY_DN9680_c0_g1_i1.p1 TRINITY_DN9680_c0_g1~~TRINITY_DN9680_c0_g1_i1.p1  ORF type:complete len:1102 (-),score=225.29 TRINITY_DN9680_c0_g1_i1:53-2944(-)